MKTCDTCKWWDKKHESHTCGQCDYKKLNDGNAGSDGLWGLGDYGDTALIYTGPKFGCVHHEEK